MSASTSGQATTVSFPNQLTSMAGLLFIPANMDKTKKYPALAVAHPFGGVKEQTAGTYARKMAEKGYVALAFDASHQGESGGYPRDTENPGRAYRGHPLRGRLPDDPSHRGCGPHRTSRRLRWRVICHGGRTYRNAR